MATIETPRKILVVEDEWLIALDIGSVIEDQGHSVVGPARTVAEALDLIEATAIDAAFLDITLGSEKSFPIARTLEEKGVPLAFLSAYGRQDIPDEFDDIDLLNKPLAPKLFGRQLRKLLGAD